MLRIGSTHLQLVFVLDGVKHWALRQSRMSNTSCRKVSTSSKVFDVKYSPWCQAGKKFLEMSNLSRNWLKNCVFLPAWCQGECLTSYTLLEVRWVGPLSQESVWRQTLCLTLTLFCSLCLTFSSTWSSMFDAIKLQMSWPIELKSSMKPDEKARCSKTFDYFPHF